MMHVSSSSISNGLSNNPKKKDEQQQRQEWIQSVLWPKVLQEARALSLWSGIALLFRLSIVLLITLAAYQYDNTSIRHILPSNSSSSSYLHKEFWTMVSVICGWVVGIAPSKLLTQQAPGFIFANPWFLLWVKDKTTIIPNIPIRVCEYMLGRISVIELISIIPVHLFIMMSTSVFLKTILPEHWLTLALEPIQYSYKNPWLKDLCREVVITAFYTVGVLVLPVLFKLNYIPRYMTTFALYPMFNFAVDEVGMASCFSPNVVLALGMLSSSPSSSIPAVYRLSASILGGLLGGKIMQRYFPDSPSASSSSPSRNNKT